MATVDQTPEDLTKGYFELVKARPDYERACAFYEGTVEEVYSSAKVTRLLAKFGLDSIDTFNFSHIPVDTLAQKLHVNAVTVDDGSSDLNNSSPASGKKSVNKEKSGVDQVLEDLWEYNELGEEFPMLHRDIGKYGDMYMFVWPVVGEEESQGKKAFDPNKSAKALSSDPKVNDQADPVEELAGTTKSIVAVDMILHDPLTTRAFYDTENPRRMKYVIRSWEEGEGQHVVVRANLYYSDRIERWMHKGKVPKRKNAKQNWEPFTEDGTGAILPNPFDQIPFFHYRTDRTYGKPDHINAYGPQLAINKLITSHMATVDYQSFPQRYALTDPTADAAGMQGADSDPFAPEDDDDPENDNMSQLEADPGSVWKLEGYKEVGQFDAANPDAYIKPFDRYVKAMAQVTGIPFHFFDRTGERPPSGENIRQVNETLNSKAETRQLSVGAVHRNAFTFALNLLGHEVERVKVTWRPLEVASGLVEWQAINEQQLAGVPPEITLVEAGYLPEEVAPWKEEWDRQAEEAKLLEQKALEQQQAMSSSSNTVRNSASKGILRDTRTSNGTPKPGAQGGGKPSPSGGGKPQPKK